jgi:hypothetical protein
MNRISPLNYSTAGASGSSPEEEGHSAHEPAQGEMTISQMVFGSIPNVLTK